MGAEIDLDSVSFCGFAPVSPDLALLVGLDSEAGRADLEAAGAPGPSFRFKAGILAVYIVGYAAIEQQSVMEMSRPTCTEPPSKKNPSWSLETHQFLLVLLSR